MPTNQEIQRRIAEIKSQLASMPDQQPMPQQDRNWAQQANDFVGEYTPDWMTGENSLVDNMGRAFAGRVGNAMQLGREIAGNEDTPQYDATQQRLRALDQKVQDSGATGFVGSVLGDPLNALPMIRGGGALMNAVANGALQGGLSGALRTTAEDENRLQNIGNDAMFGAGVSAAINKALRPFGSKLNAEDKRLLKVLEAEGVPLSPAQRTGSKMLRGVEAAFNDLPQTAGAQAAKEGKRASAFNKAVLSRAGFVGDEATPATISSMRDNFTKRYDDLTSRNPIAVDRPLYEKLIEIDSEAARRLGKDNTSIRSYIEDIAKFAESGQRMDGKLYQQTRSDLGRIAKSQDPIISGLAKQLKSAIDDAAARSISPKDAASWMKTNKEYANYKAISKAQQGSGNSTLSGDISPAGLLQAVKMGNRGYAAGDGDLNDLARAGTRFLRDSTPNSGTAARQGNQILVQSILGGAGVMASGGNPLGVAAGLAAPKAAQVLYDVPFVQQYLSGAITPKAGEVATKAVISGNARAQTDPAKPAAPQQMTPEQINTRINEIKQMLQQQSSAAPSSYLNRVQQTESGGNPNAQNPSSSASGLYQFTDPTWNSMVKKYGARTGITSDMKNNPQAQQVFAELLTQENAQALRQTLGREPSEGELYLAHFAGAGGAKRLLKIKNKDAPAANILPKAAQANKSVFYDGKRKRSVNEVINIITRKV
jgi:hypothetical protein